MTDESCHFGDLTEPADEMGTDSEDFLSSGTPFCGGECLRSSAVKSSIQ